MINSCSWYGISKLNPRPGIRQRDPGEIVPVRAEHSSTYQNNETTYGAYRAIDLQLGTHSTTDIDPDTGKFWLKVVLDKVHLVQQVKWYQSDNRVILSWSCTENDCSNCEGSCQDYTLTVSTEGTAQDFFPVSDYRYGDIVKIEGTSSFDVCELAIIGKEGNISFSRVYNWYPVIFFLNEKS